MQSSQYTGQKAPSAKRCIKTALSILVRMGSFFVRKHRAPKGALRLVGECVPRVGERLVRKHRAPKGALRLLARVLHVLRFPRQKAPSAKRCIKTIPHTGWSAD